MKKVLSVSLAILLALALCASAAAEGVQSVTLYGFGVTIPDEDPIIPELESRLGIDITMVDSGGTDTSSLVARIAGGDIPDVFVVDSMSKLSSFYESGVLLNLADYMDLIPNINATFTEQDWARMTFDGGIYAIPRRGEVNYCNWWIRYDWMEQLGAEYPTTFDELFDLAKTINEADLDGNGKADTYAIGGSMNFGREDAFSGFYTAYGVNLPQAIMIVDNKAVLSCEQPGFRLAIDEIRRFVDAGLVDPEVVSNNQDSNIEKMATGRTGIVFGGWAAFGRQTAQDTLKAVDENARWGHMQSDISTDYGISGATKTAASFSSMFALSADLADDPDKLAAALSIFDYTCHDEGDLLMSYGIEDYHYTVEDGAVVKQDAMNELGYGWALQFTGRNDMVYCMTKFIECADEVEYAANNTNVYYHYGDLVQQPEGINVSDITSYVQEQVTQFVLGGREMSEYDEFIDTLYNLYSLQEYLDSANEQLTRLGYIN